MSKKQNKRAVSRSILAEMSVAEGLHFIRPENVKSGLYFMGERVKRDKQRFEILRSCELRCFSCGIKASSFRLDKHKNDRVMPFMVNLYSGETMLTWDHIIPQSLGGSDHPFNGRIACNKCNERRGNEMSLVDLFWVNRQDPLYVYRTVTERPLSLETLINNSKVRHLPEN